MNPKVRKSNIYRENLPGEVILYDKNNHKAHCLNMTVATVWENADGTRTVDELAAILEQKLGIPRDRDVVLVAIDQLEEAGLMEETGEPVTEDKVSRRQLGRKLAMVGLAASMQPLLASVKAPTPGQASSGGTYNAQTYTSELMTVQGDIAKNPLGFLSNKSAQKDFNAAITSGNEGIIDQLQGNTSGATQDFQTAQNDFNNMLGALGLPPLS